MCLEARGYTLAKWNGGRPIEWRLAEISFVIALLLTGCSTYAGARYSISADTVRMLRAFKGQSVSVGEFTAAKPGRSEIFCRGVGPIKTPDGEPFEAYIRKALIDELTIAELHVDRAPVVLVGHVDELDFSSGWTDAEWTIGLTLRSSNGRALTVTENYRFAGNFVGEIACNQTAHALMPAVQNVVARIVRHPDFAGLLK
jgi:hypothetical protein